MKLRAFLLTLIVPVAFAASPRWVVSSSDALDGTPMRWANPDVRYYVDAGPLSVYVSHDAAVALVKAAADPWNQPSAAVTLTQGGELAEDVNSANVYVGTNGPIWPQDVTSWTANVSRIAVLLDADGSLTDMLLGAGASDPLNCRQNAVTESMDVISAGRLQHDIIVVNGRCTGPAKEQQLQLQYQLMRAFGRALGIGWSQTNDNVFAGPSPTYTQQQHWPIMHPIDILCGIYSYQCLVNPFQLRDDDIAALGLLYTIPANAQIPAGKEATLAHGTRFSGKVTFPDGLGMAGVNVTAKAILPLQGIYEDWEDVTSVSGFMVKDFAGNPVSGASVTSVATGSKNRNLAGSYVLQRVTIPANAAWQNISLATQTINPLYIGQYSVGPYHTSTVAPSGAQTLLVIQRYANSDGPVNLSPNSTAIDCSAGFDGSEVAPAPVLGEGIWTGRFCGYGHTAWMSTPVDAGHSMTIEVTALDEFGNASTAKALPMIGVWSANDAAGMLPTIAASTSPLNGTATGTTTLSVSTNISQQLRVGITEQRGEGRPDFGYRARVLYAGSIEPSQLPLAGGRIVVRGMGFQTGNSLTIGGVLAQVQALSANEIVAVAPAFSTAGKKDIVITDLRTGGSTKIVSGLQYGALSTDTLVLVSAPDSGVVVGSVAAAPLGVRVISAEGTPVTQAAVQFSANNVQFGCGSAQCTVTTDAAGLAQTTVSPTATGMITLSASMASGQRLSSKFQSVASARSLSPVKAIQYIAADTDVTWQPAVVAVEDGKTVSSLPVSWSQMTPQMFNAQAKTDVTGQSSTTVSTRVSDGAEAALQACAWTTICTSPVAHGVSSTAWRVEVVSGGIQSITAAETLSSVVLRITDGNGNPVQGVNVDVFQSVEGWQPPCNGIGRCATPPRYGTENATVVSDADGLFTITPLEYAATASITRIVVSAGPNGYLSLSLEKHP